MLPKLDVPIFETKLISTGKTVKFRPFLVKEQKLLLMASQSDDIKDAVDAIKQVLNNCIVTKDVDIDDLPIFDIENLFIQLRSRSVGEVVNLRYTCNNIVDNEKCGAIVNVDVDLNTVKPELDPRHTNKIQLTEKMGLVMKYPNFKIMKKFELDDNADIFDVIVDCIDYVYDENNVYYAKDVSRAELIEFIETMQKSDFEKIELFFSTLPKIRKEEDFKCHKCGYHEKITIEGVQNFFG